MHIIRRPTRPCARFPSTRNLSAAYAHAGKMDEAKAAQISDLGPGHMPSQLCDGEAGCEQVMHLIAGARGAMAGLMAEVVEDHVRTHLVDAEKHPEALNTEAAEQLLDVVRTYLK